MRIEKDLDFNKIRGLTIHVACDYCEETGRVPGGKYRAEGEVINCPMCNGPGVRPTIISLKDFSTLMTLLSKQVKPRSWSRKRKKKTV